MDPANYGYLIYLVLLLTALCVWAFTGQRRNLGKMARYLGVWVMVFMGILVAVLLWNDLRSDIAPQQSVLRDGAAVEVPRSADGHYYLVLEVNGVPTRFVVDTGASQIVLTRADAEAAGIDTGSLIFTGRASTANGMVETAPIRIESLSLAGQVDQGVRAVVNSGEMRESLLGMTYLTRFSRMEFADGRLLLER